MKAAVVAAGAGAVDELGAGAAVVSGETPVGDGDSSGAGVVVFSGETPVGAGVLSGAGEVFSGTELGGGTTTLVLCGGAVGSVHPSVQVITEVTMRVLV